MYAAFFFSFFLLSHFIKLHFIVYAITLVPIFPSLLPLPKPLPLPLPQAISTPLSLSMGHTYMLFGYSIPLCCTLHPHDYSVTTNL